MTGLDWPAPDVSTLCRRQARIAVQIPYRPSGQPLTLPVDSTGIKFRGDGEWLVRKHGTSRRHRAKRDPVRHPASGPGAVEEVSRVSRSKSDQGPHELPLGFQLKDHVTRPRPSDRRNPDPPANMNRYNAPGTAEIEAVA